MQTFLPYADFNKSAKCLDNKRLGKQRVEAWQIYNTLQKIKARQNIINKEIQKYTGYSLKDIENGKVWWVEDHWIEDINHKITWENHPAVKMWKGYEYVLLIYMEQICIEWIKRGFKDTLLEKCKSEQKNFTPISGGILAEPKWIGNKDFHSSHRSNLLRKDQEYYEKFGWKESDDLEYFWPTKEGY